MKCQTKIHQACALCLWSSLFVVIFVCCCVAGPARAQINQTQDIAHLDLESLLDDVVYSASKHEETLAEAPSNVFIVSREMIKDHGCRNIGEALALVPGIYVTDDYSFQQIGVRGISQFGDWNSRVMVLVDGRPMVEQYSGSSSIDIPGVEIENIDRIEVVKGPSSSLYGSNAFFGIINLITKKPTANELAVYSKYFSETQLKGLGFHLNRRITRDLNLLVTGNILDRGGSNLFFPEFSQLTDGSLALDDDGYNQYYLDSSDFTGGYAQKRNKLENYSAHAVLTWRDFSLTVQHAKQIAGLSHGAYGALFNRPENEYREKRSFLELAYQGSLSPRADIGVRLSYLDYTWSDHFLYNYYEWEDEPLYLPGPIWVDLEFNNYLATELRLQLQTGNNNHTIIGVESQFHHIRHESGESDQIGNDVLDNIIPTANVEDNGRIYNAYVQNEHQLSEQIKAVGGRSCPEVCGNCLT